MSNKIETFENNPSKGKEIESTLREIEKKYKTLSENLDKLCEGKTRSEQEQIARDFFHKNTDVLKKAIQSQVMFGTDREQTETDALESALPKAYALVKLASKFLWEKPHFDSQMRGGILLNQGYVTEMATGEGKTLTAALPAYLNALLGKGVHVITTNGYLAKSNHEEMSQLYNLLGLTCGLAEERNMSLDEEIQKIVKKKISEYIKNYVPGNYSADDYHELEVRFYRDKANRQLIRKIEKDAKKEARAQYIAKRRAAYEADITYGASEVFAFDYLYDDISKNYSDIVQRAGRPYFAITDEVDSVLVDTATSPYVLSGTQSDAELEISDSEKKQIDKEISLANFAIYKIFTESVKEKNENGEALVSRVDEDSFEALEQAYGGEKKVDDNAKNIIENKAIIISDKSKRFILTPLGESIIFQYYCDDVINNLLDKYGDDIINLQDGYREMFHKDIDYTVDENGKINMSSKALYRLIKSGEIKELTSAFEEFSSTQLFDISQAIDNSIRAWFVLKENGSNGDYILKKPVDAENPNQRVIALTSEGRTAEGRVYSNGLQQAIEAKERILKPNLDIVHTNVSTTLASIPTSSFFARYEKFSGMTGTAAVGIFNNLYNLTTFAVPRNKKYAGIDHGDVLYLTKEEKFEAIYESVKKSYEKGQPVLLATTSIKESEELYRFLIQSFSRDIGKDKVPQIPVLNARVDALDEEAKIVSRAGLPSAITITTEMAGRGTDIKLGGEALSEKEAFDKLVDISLANYRKNHIASDDDRKKIEQLLSNPFNPQKQLIQEKIYKLIDESKAKCSGLKKQIESVGGLKVIGTGHYIYSRVDNQVKGRCARQGDPGEIIFFNDVEGLEKIGVPQDVIEKIEKDLKAKSPEPIIESDHSKNTPISDAIYEAQCRNEAMVEVGIKQQQDIENEMAKYRSELHTTRTKLLKDGSYVDAIEKLIINVSDKILDIAGVPEVEHGRKRILKDKVDFGKIMSLTSEFLGIDFTQEDLQQCKRAEDLRNMLTKAAVDRFESKISGISKDEASTKCADMFETIVSRGWINFEEISDNLRNQKYLNAIVQRQSGFDNQHILSASIMKAFDYCLESQTAIAIREMLNPNYKEKGYDSTGLRKMRVTVDGFEEVTDEYESKDKETKKDKKDNDDEKTYQMRVKNLSPTAKMFASSGRTAINRDSGKVGSFSSYYGTDSEDVVASVDFGSSTSGYSHKGK